MSDTTAPSLTETLYSLTGFDEIAIRKAFPEVELFDGEGTAREGLDLTRAMIFTLKRRQGMKDSAAYEATMNIPLRELDGFFATNDEDLEDEDGTEAEPFPPVTPAGKDSAPLATEPDPSRTGALPPTELLSSTSV